MVDTLQPGTTAAYLLIRLIAVGIFSYVETYYKIIIIASNSAIFRKRRRSSMFGFYWFIITRETCNATQNTIAYSGVIGHYFRSTVDTYSGIFWTVISVQLQQ